MKETPQPFPSEASQRTENIYQTLLEDALAGYWDWNIQERTAFISPTFKAMFGYGRHELLNTTDHWKQIIFSEDIPGLFRAYKAHVSSKGTIPFQVEVRYHHKKGDVVWVLCTGRIVEWSPAGEPLRMVGCHIDITRQKHIEENLRVSETRFKGAFEYSAIGMALVSKEGKWLKVNRQICRLLGYVKEELLKKTFQEITHPEDLDLDIRNVQKMLSNKIKTYQMEKRYLHKNGHVIWALLSVSLVKDANGEPLYFVSQIEDITQRKKAEQDLLAVNTELKGILDASTRVAIIGVDKTGVITHFNSGAENLLQYTSGEIVGKYRLTRFHKPREITSRGKTLSHLAGQKISGFEALVTYARAGKFESREWTYVRRDGTTFPVELVVTAIRNTEEEIIGFLAVAVDVTERVTKRNELHQAKEELEILNRKLKKQNTQLGDFAHITSHNLRAPVSNLRSLLMMYNVLDKQEEKEALFEKFETVTNHLSDTLGDLVDTLKVTENPDVTRHNLSFEKVLNKVTEILSGKILETGGQIEYDFKNLPKIRYNRSYLESILLHLISNALKYRSAGRTPVVKVKTWKEENGEMKLSVSDNGIGIDMQRQGHKLFGLHKTFHRHPESKGVGLFITKARIEAQGGEIKASSVVDEGSTFTITFNKVL